MYSEMLLEIKKEISRAIHGIGIRATPEWFMKFIEPVIKEHLFSYKPYDDSVSLFKIRFVLHTAGTQELPYAEEAEQMFEELVFSYRKLVTHHHDHHEED